MFPDILPGTTFFPRFVFVFSAVVGAAMLLTAVLALFYRRFWYERFMRSTFETNYRPRCAVVVPCKGIVKHFRKSVRAYLGMDYADYEVIFAVESETDPAAEVVREVIRDNPRARLVVAGLSDSCAQKNWNMLCAVRSAPDAEVYVFADGDIIPESGWLRELVLPLSRSGIAATTGFRWLQVARGGVAEQVHVCFNSFLYGIFCLASWIGSAGLWGGSMAIRRKDFERLGVARRWSETAVDDLSLAELIMERKERSLFVPACVTPTDDALRSVPKVFGWIERQMMFLKMYHTHLWSLAMPLVCGTVAVLIGGPVAALLSGGSWEKFVEYGGAGTLAFVALDLLSVSTYPLLGRMHRFGSLVLMLPLLRLILLLSLMKTLFTNTITWSGVQYRIKVSTGTVKTLRRESS